MSIQQNTALFSLLGTNYGGDGVHTFGLPNLQGAVPVGSGQRSGGSLYIQGEQGGEIAHTLTIDQMPSHNHLVGVSSASGTTATASTTTAIGSPPTSAFGPASNVAAMGGTVGNGQPHNNMQPYLPMNFCIAVQGVFPVRD